MSVWGQQSPTTPVVGAKGVKDAEIWRFRTPYKRISKYLPRNRHAPLLTRLLACLYLPAEGCASCIGEMFDGNDGNKRMKDEG